mmetsp:Transcript_37793/g.112359  ORF Transcript_37793/g.112359 Transcript_37793/m.112359 type:complete len:227 (-) Transcript_37793:99-779(-)
MMVGSSSPSTAICSSAAFEMAATVLKRGAGVTTPPARQAQPSTSRVFERIEPRREVWTTARRPRLSAQIATMSSVALPNVALSSPLRVSLVWSATCSVASPRRAASGRMPKQQSPNTTPSEQPSGFAASATGTATSSTYSLFPANMRREPSSSAGGGTTSSAAAYEFCCSGSMTDGIDFSIGGLEPCEIAVTVRTSSSVPRERRRLRGERMLGCRVVRAASARSDG